MSDWQVKWMFLMRRSRSVRDKFDRFLQGCLRPAKGAGVIWNSGARTLAGGGCFVEVGCQALRGWMLA